MKLIDGDKLERHLDYLIQKEEQLAKECSLSPNNEFERQRRYCFEANALAYGLCKNVMNYYIVADAQVMNQWISVKDRLPEENQKCLVYRDINTDLKITTGIWHSDMKEFYGLRHGTRLEDTIAWMPLLEPPKDGGING